MASTEITARADERRILKKYLTWYFRAKQKKALLQGRLHSLQRTIQSESAENESPSEIEARIQRQAEEAERSVLGIMDILDCLPADSTERAVMELRHIDCKTWQKICDTAYLSRSSCFRHYNKGMDTLLESSKVRSIIGLSK